MDSSWMIGIKKILFVLNQKSRIWFIWECCMHFHKCKNCSSATQIENNRVQNIAGWANSNNLISVKSSVLHTFDFNNLGILLRINCEAQFLFISCHHFILNFFYQFYITLCISLRSHVINFIFFNFLCLNFFLIEGIELEGGAIHTIEKIWFLLNKIYFIWSPAFK